MRFVPNYNVIYNGEYHPAGVEFNINDSDADSMRKHGTVHEDIKVDPVQNEPTKRGRRRKAT